MITSNETNDADTLFDGLYSIIFGKIKRVLKHPVRRSSPKRLTKNNPNVRLQFIDFRKNPTYISTEWVHRSTVKCNGQVTLEVPPTTDLVDVRQRGSANTIQSVRRPHPQLRRVSSPRFSGPSRLSEKKTGSEPLVRIVWDDEFRQYSGGFQLSSSLYKVKITLITLPKYR